MKTTAPLQKETSKSAVTVTEGKATKNPLQLHSANNSEIRNNNPLQLYTKKENKTGLPDKLKENTEWLSGFSMDDVQVHYNSDKPAQLNALAYTQGTDIHVAPGQERHLPHEAWHVVQQKQGRVKATMQMKGSVAINDDRGLEKEADMMGAKAMKNDNETEMQEEHLDYAASNNQIIQRAVGFEFETGYKIEKKKNNAWVKLKKLDVVKKYANGINLTADENSAGFSAIELVLDPPVQESQPEKFTKALQTFRRISAAFDAIKPGRGVDVLNPVKFNSIRGVSGSSNYRVTPTFSGFRGNPQITGGVRYDKLITFLEEAVTSNTKGDLLSAEYNLTEHKDKEQDTTPIAGAKREVDKIKGSEQLKGLVAFLGMYLKSGAAGPGKPIFNYAKLISNSFMARTDFAKMFSKLPEEERLKFIHDPMSFVNLVLSAAGLSGTENKKVLERGVRKSDIKTHADYTKDITDEINELKITRQEWLLRITMGTDVISSSGMPHLKDILMGLGALGNKTDRVGDDPVPRKGAKDKGRGIILELRNMRQDKSADDFAVIAQNIFNYIVAMNAKT